MAIERFCCKCVCRQTGHGFVRLAATECHKFGGVPAACLEGSATVVRLADRTGRIKIEASRKTKGEMHHGQFITN